MSKFVTSLPVDVDSLIAKLPSGSKSEAEDEAMEIVILEDGFPAEVLPGEDHATRILVLLGWLAKMSVTRVPVDPLAKTRIVQHMMLHYQYLKQTQPQAAKQIAARIVSTERGLAMLASGKGQPAAGGPPAPAPALGQGQPQPMPTNANPV